MNENDFLKEVQEAFKIESQERLADIGDLLVELEALPEPARKAEILEILFRDAHSLKGAARSVDMTDVESICQSVEGVFDILKQAHDVEYTPELFDILYEWVNVVEAITQSKEEIAQETILNIMSRIDEIREVLLPTGELSQSEKGQKASSAEQTVDPQKEETVKQIEMESETLPSDEDKPAKADSGTSASIPVSEEAKKIPEISHATDGPIPQVQIADKTMQIQKVPAYKLTRLFQRAEAMIAQKLVSEKHLLEIKELGHELERWRRKWTRASKEASFSAWNANFVQRLAKSIHAINRQTDRNHFQLTRMVDDLMDVAREVIMLPCSTMLTPFPRLVREMSHEQNKDIAIKMSGQDIELDRRILDEMRDPLMHMLRNAVDHGIEPPEERRSLGKPLKSTLLLSVTRIEGDKVAITLKDDGRGPDLKAVRQSAVKHGLISLEDSENLSEQQTLQLMFSSGVSTSRKVTKISGRGLGMAIVLEKVERLGGSISVSGKKDKGMQLTITLPISIITFQGLLVKVHSQSFIIPSVQISGVVRLHRSKIGATGRLPTIPYDDDVVPLVNLGKLLNIPNNNEHEANRSNMLTAVVAKYGEAKVAFQVDEAVGMLEVLVKPFGPQIKRLRGLSGAAALGSGIVVPVLEINDLIKMSKQNTSITSVAQMMEMEVEDPGKILVVDDSITSRTLLKSILEMEGFLVATSEDGAEAIRQLEANIFDVVVSDIQMPNVDGFELTEYIRAHDKLKNIPVILITSLDSDEDWNHGMEVGASAYFKKAAFNQSELLSAIKDLL